MSRLCKAGCAAGSCSKVPGRSCGPMACWHTGVTHVFMCFYHLELLFRDYFNRYVLNTLFKVMKFGCMVYFLWCLSFEVALGKSQYFYLHLDLPKETTSRGDLIEFLQVKRSCCLWTGWGWSWANAAPKAVALLPSLCWLAPLPEVFCIQIFLLCRSPKCHKGIQLQKACNLKICSNSCCCGPY